ncbi:S49 family peptidase [Pantoea agglomerans]|uniref:S49 family peptidase n=1 Tax=Enterobacter agglomerans TaxID=549 RepID=UPI0013BAC7C8|nr:S49 family peptidase [Pantoea agglomerans]NEG58195.1 S49 family peptidase [Pantoea agglomerans]NEG99908.1 S49 family peptidase [Pantoea agglomerans]NEH04129.1 S49 family peptidase [Pantoea agglomerans]NEH14468.1 S49 family peptidase [Pantoea agglomerans]
MSWTDYPHLAARVLNQPLMMDPAWAQGFFSSLGDRLGAARDGDEKRASEGLSAQGVWGGDAGREARPYRVEQGVAVLSITGALVHKFGYLKPLCGMTGYDGIVARLNMAMGDPDVKGVLLDIDSPGGEVSGAFDTADLIARMGKIKPVWALAGDMATSAAYLLASACSRRLITQTGTVGSIGVVVAHRCVEKQLEQAGVAITLIHAGAHKVDGNPYETLPEDVRQDIQARVDETRAMFAQKVSDNTDLPLDAVLATEAKTYDGGEAVKYGLADEVINYADAVATLSRFVKQKGGLMKPETDNATAGQLADTTATTITAETQADAAEMVATAATQERERIMGILSCEEAKGREALAQALAATPGMSAGAARTILQASPMAPQARTETALDTLMTSESPAPLDTGTGKPSAQEARLSGLMKSASRLKGATHE